MISLTPRQYMWIVRISVAYQLFTLAYIYRQYRRLHRNFQATATFLVAKLHEHDIELSEFDSIALRQMGINIYKYESSAHDE